MSADTRLVARSLSGFLCGTHSGALRKRGRGLLSIQAMGEALPRDDPGAGPATRLGRERWVPREEARRLAGELDDALSDPAVVDLIVFGSEARGSTTGFSDFDALLVVDDDAARSPDALVRLRREVLAAQRAVLRHQPLQHHGFEVATPGLLAHASEALGIPEAALNEARSLRGIGASGTFDPRAEQAQAAFRALAGAVATVRRWPSHPWELHRVVSMFELVPALWLQAQGNEVAKWESFEAARRELGSPRWPWSGLEQVRLRWPRRAWRFPLGASAVVRNPWLAVAAWRRLPARVPAEARRLLSQSCLEDLRQCVELMLRRA